MGISPHANMPSYGAAKAAMNNFTLVIQGIGLFWCDLNALMPGLTYTKQLDSYLQQTARNKASARFGKAMDYVLKNIVRQTVSRRAMSTISPTMFAIWQVALSDFMTGTVVRIDGGSTPTV